MKLPSTKGCLRYIRDEILRLGIILLLLAGGIYFASGIIQNLYNQIAAPFNFPSLFFGPPGALTIPDNIYIPPVERVQALAQLHTTRFNFSRAVSGQQDMPPVLSALYGDGLIMVAVGHIDAGINISQISADDILYSDVDNTLTITLPSPTLQTCFLDEQQSYVVSRQTGIFASPMRNLESSTRLYALRQYRDQALEDGILDVARAEVERIMTEFLQIVSGEELTIQILFHDPVADAPFPESCR